MDNNRFIIELGTGIDLHGEDVTEAACRAVRDAVSSSCLCGLVEVLKLEKMDQVQVEILIGCPKPDEVDREKVAAEVPIGRKTVAVTLGGMQVKGLCVPRFGPDCDQIVMANAAVTVCIDPKNLIKIRD